VSRGIDGRQAQQNPSTRVESRINHNSTALESIVSFEIFRTPVPPLRSRTRSVFPRYLISSSQPITSLSVATSVGAKKSGSASPSIQATSHEVRGQRRETLDRENRTRALKLASHGVVNFDPIARGAADTCGIKHLRSITRAARPRFRMPSACPRASSLAVKPRYGARQTGMAPKSTSAGHRAIGS
jgi:hypothetical protein